MTRRDRNAPAHLAGLAALVSLATGCPDSNQNPRVLWLAPDGSETRVHLVDQEPDPF